MAHVEAHPHSVGGLAHAPVQQHTVSGKAHAEGQQHPIGVYLWVWGALFVFSLFSYLVDFFHVQGLLRWSLILIFMIIKAGLIVAIFMHMKWERLALAYAILLPPVFVLVFVWLMTHEADYTALTRGIFFGNGT